MDQERFDRLTRLVATSSRRQFVRAAAGAAAGAVLAALGLADALAAPNPDSACRRCRGRTCTPRNEGRSCGSGSGRCGTCAGGACVANAGACFDCEVCSPTTKTCVPAPNREGTTCGFCGVCEEGQCVRGKTRDGEACGSCGACDDGRCRKQDDRCDTGACQRCRRQADGTYACESKCRTGEECCNGDCVPEGKCCGETVCRASEICCREQGVCKRNLEECCRGCSACQTCDRDTGACLVDEAKEGQRCPADGPCAGICEGGACRKVVQNQRCADGNRCCADGCCSGSVTSCCGGVCCNTGECCDGQCCAGFCVLGVCCPIGFTAAEVTDAEAVAAGAPVCCPNGPPCGSSCCDAGEACCEGVCRDSCGCEHPQVPCPGEGCCPVGTICSSDGCCPQATHVVCGGGGVIPPGDPNRPCCERGVEVCGGSVQTNFQEEWCCPVGQAHFGDRGCCPPDKPLFTALTCVGGTPGDIYCCREGTLRDICDDFDAYCTQQTVPGR